ncbi:MAG: hypothetical protein WCE73_12530, partial [Candidatus Angelobacter sp.]
WLFRGVVPKRAILFAMLLVALSSASRAQSKSISVEVVATASEYVPSSTTFTHPGHSYMNCLGSTSYFGQFHSYGDSGFVSGTADTNTRCETTYTPPTETTLTSYRKLNYTIAKGEHALYLLSCTQTWEPSTAARIRAGLLGGVAAYGRTDSREEEQAQIKAQSGKWSECPAFGIGAKYALTVNSTSDVQLDDGDETKKTKKPVKLEYLGSASLAAMSDPVPSPTQAQTASIADRAEVHIPSTPGNQPGATRQGGVAEGAAQHQEGKPRGVLDSVILQEAFTNANGVVLVTLASSSKSSGEKTSTYHLSCNREVESCRIPWKDVVYTLLDAGSGLYECQNVSLYKGETAQIRSADFYGIYCLDGLK